MNKFIPAAVIAVAAHAAILPSVSHATETSQSVRVATDTVAPVSVTAGKMIYGANGQRVAAVYRVSAAGGVQVILDGKLVTVPATTLTEANGKVMTSLTKQELLRSK